MATHQTKKILFLVASEVQLPAIEYAKEKGYYIITCDNEPQNPGHQLADKNIFISVYEKEKIYQEVKDLKINAVVSFVSVHGLHTAAYLSDRLGLNSIKPINLRKLTDKGKFRNMLDCLSLTQPNYTSKENFTEDIDCNLEYPIIVKPVDKGGNVGITKLADRRGLKKAFDIAWKASEEKYVILEEFIEGTSVNGDCVVVGNKIITHFIGDYLYNNELNAILPYATLFPTKIDTSEVISQLEHILQSINFGNGIINFEAIIKGGIPYIIEINPRFSGNYIYKLMDKAFNIDSAGVCVELALGAEYSSSFFKRNKKYYCYSLLAKSNEGYFHKMKLKKQIEGHLFFKKIFKENGELVDGFNTLHSRIAILLMEFDDRKKMEQVNKNLHDYFNIELK